MWICLIKKLLYALPSWALEMKRACPPWSRHIPSMCTLLVWVQSHDKVGWDAWSSCVPRKEGNWLFEKPMVLPYNLHKWAQEPLLRLLELFSSPLMFYTCYSRYSIPTFCFCYSVLRFAVISKKVRCRKKRQV